MSDDEGKFKAYFENETRKFLTSLNIDPTLLSNEISHFTDSVLAELIEAFEYKLKNYCVDDDYTCTSLSDVFKAIEDMCENIITAYETIDNLECELENKE